MEKRKRNVNFSATEEELLVELVKKYQNIIENKKTDMVMWKEKEECWRKISEEFNSQGVLVARSCTQLQLKYKNLKKVIRKKCALIRFEHLKTGGGKDLSQALNHREENLKSIIQLSVDGLRSEFDDDNEAISNDNLPDDNVLLDNDEYYEDKDNIPFYMTVMPDGTEDSIPSTSTNTNTQTKQTQSEQTITDVRSNEKDIYMDKGASVSKWDVVTPQHLKHVKSIPLRTNKKHFKSRSAEATNLLQQKDKLVELQIKALEQEIGINDIRKRNMILKEQKMQLEIELLKTKLNSPKY